MDWIITLMLGCAVIAFVALCCLIHSGNIERKEEKINEERMKWK